MAMDENQSDSAEPADFDEGVAYQQIAGDGLPLNLEGYEGPLDILLSLARTQKVDLKQISILQLAEQYLDFVRQAQDLKIEVAADYLVMASWLAYLKSRLLLPKQDDGDSVARAAQLAAGCSAGDLPVPVGATARPASREGRARGITCLYIFSSSAAWGPLKTLERSLISSSEASSRCWTRATATATATASTAPSARHASAARASVLRWAPWCQLAGASDSCRLDMCCGEPCSACGIALRGRNPMEQSR